MKYIIATTVILGLIANTVVGLGIGSLIVKNNDTQMQLVQEQMIALQQLASELKEPDLGGPVVEFVTGKVYTLSGSGITSSATSITLTSFTDRSGNVKLSMEQFGDVGYLTLEPTVASKTEFVQFTGVTQNANGTATLTGVTRGLEFVQPYTASTTLQQAHSGGAKAIIADPPQLFNQFLTEGDDHLATGFLQFSSTTPPAYDAAPTLSTTTELAHKGYVDNVANAGAATSTETNGGIVELATQQEAGSSTPLTAEKPLVLHSAYATTTPEDNCAALESCVAMTVGQYLSQSFLDLSQIFAFSSTTSFTGTSTFNGGIDIGSTLFRANGQDYTFPPEQNASSTVLKTDGAGSLSWENADWELLVSTTTAQTLSTTTTSFDARQDLLIVFDGSVTADGRIVEMKFDEGAPNYGWIQTINGGASSEGSGTTRIDLSNTASLSAGRDYYVIRVRNISGNVKYITWNGTYASTGSNAPDTIEGSGVWNNTSQQINEVIFTVDVAANGFSAGTNIRVYGSRD